MTKISALAAAGTIGPDDLIEVVQGGINTKALASSLQSSFVGARAIRTTAQSIPNTTWTAVIWNSETFDTGGFIDTAGATPSRFTIPTGKAGRYRIVAMDCWAASVTTPQRALAVNGTRVAQVVGSNTGTTAGTGFGVADVLNLAVADYLEFHLYHSTGGAKDQMGGAYGAPFMSIEYLGA